MLIQVLSHEVCSNLQLQLSPNANTTGHFILSRLSDMFEVHVHICQIYLPAFERDICVPKYVVGIMFVEIVRSCKFFRFD